jgi:hypothetical protein
MKTISSKYTMVYPFDNHTDNTEIEENGTNLKMASENNWKVNTKIYGDAIRETSAQGTGNTSWNEDYSIFTGLQYPFFFYGGAFLNSTGNGLFSFTRGNGSNKYNDGFRAILVVS